MIEELKARTRAVVTRCPRCGDTQHVWVAPEDYIAWKEGEVLIQETMPYLTADERESLVSGSCARCWDIMFKDDENE